MARTAHRILDPSQLGQIGAPPATPNKEFLAKLIKPQDDARLGPALASPSTLNTQRHTLNYTAFAIASAAVDNRPKDPAPTVVLENHIGRVLDNTDPVRMVC